MRRFLELFGRSARLGMQVTQGEYSGTRMAGGDGRADVTFSTVG